MNLETISAIVIAAVGALLLGMAALIKGMVLGKLNEIQKSMAGMTRDFHRMDVRVTKLETEHRLNACRYHEDGYQTQPGVSR